MKAQEDLDAARAEYKAAQIALDEANADGIGDLYFNTTGLFLTSPITIANQRLARAKIALINAKAALDALE